MLDWLQTAIGWVDSVQHVAVVFSQHELVSHFVYWFLSDRGTGVVMADPVSVGLSLVGTGASLYGQKKAISAQEKAARDSNALQLAMYEQQRADQQGYRDRGDLAGNQIAMLLGLKSMDGTRASWGKGGRFGEFSQALSPGQITKEPGYQFGLQQGNDAITRAAAAGGGVYSGATLKALQRYGQDYAGTKYNEAYGRARNNRLDQFNMLASLSGLGQVATGQTQQASQNYGNNVGNTMLGMGAAQGGFFTNLGNQIGSDINYWNAQRMQPPTAGNDPMSNWSRFGTSGD